MVEGGAGEGLAAVPPGPSLSAALAAVNLRQVPSDRVVDVLRAQSRQSAHEQARLWASLLEVGLAVPDDHGSTVPVRAAEVSEWAAGEIAAALTWTRRTAERELWLAEVVVRVLPAVFAELWAGRIDRAKAVVFAEYLDPANGVTAEQAAAVLATLLPGASKLTTGQLRARLWRALLAIDPDWARRRYARAVRGRAVTAVLADDGTATITGSGLPVDQAATACARVDRLAEAVKRAGHPEGVSQIAADVFLGLLAGRFHGLSEEQIIAVLLRELRAEDAGGEMHTDDGPGADGPGADGPGGDGPGADGRGADGRGAARPGAVEIPTGIEIRVGLATVLGLDERPGEIPGLGPVLAPVARTVVARQVRGAEWRFAVTDAEGYLVLAGVTRCRPRGRSAAGDRRAGDRRAGECRGGVVELQVCAAQLAELAGAVAASTEAGHDDGARPEPWIDAWAGVLADIAAQFADRDGLLAALDARPRDRFPGAALARHIQVRDRTCSHPGCARPARRSDLDHTRDHARGGATIRSNLGPGCRRHHLFKHDLGWRLAQPRPGMFVWTSPLGQTYRTRGEPVSPPLPDAHPRTEGPRPPPVDPDDGPLR